MKKSIIGKIALSIFAVALVTMALPGCSKKADNQQQATVQTTQEPADAISEIDAFVMSVTTVKNSFDQNKMVFAQVEDAKTQAMIMEGFIAEMPNLYEDAEYKTKMTEIYNMVEAIDPAKQGLEKEEGADTSFNGLKTIVERLFKKFK